ncbi:hypothetical protein B0H14DRAFT_2946196, partial [Mycena olivaceomarginata]
MIIWLLPASLSFAAILERNPTKQTAVVADCVLDRFMKLRCVPGGMDVILAFAIFGILVRASWTIFHRAIAIHGEADMALPADTPPPGESLPAEILPSGQRGSGVDAGPYGGRGAGCGRGSGRGRRGRAGV